MRHASFSRYLLRFLIIIGFGMIGVVLAEAGPPTQDTTPPPPESCAECHLDIVAAWEGGTHAQAYSDPIFQSAWQEQANALECLECHTTGFVARTGEYEHEGVTCEACHGQTPAEHPESPVSIDPGVEICADCHTTTFTEWEESEHGNQQLACTTCHQPHPQQLRFEEANMLCLNCHDEEARDDYAHLTHTDQECVDCHWFHADLADLQEHYMSGNLFPTGHAGKVETQSCVSCHEEQTESGVIEQGEEALAELDLPVSTHPLLQAQVQIKELEAEVDTVQAQGANTSALRMVQGLIIGLVVGGLGVFGVTRFRQRTTRVVEEQQEE
jgi:hypothetical protein